MICHKCQKQHKRIGMFRAYTNAAGWVRLCLECAKSKPTGYYFAYETRRHLGENIPKGARP